MSRSAAGAAAATACGSGASSAARCGPPRTISSRYRTRSRNCCRSASVLARPMGISEAASSARSSMAATGISVSVAAPGSRTTIVSGVSRAMRPETVRPSLVTSVTPREVGRIDAEGSRIDATRCSVSWSPSSGRPVSGSGIGSARFGPIDEGRPSTPWQRVQVDCVVWNTTAPRPGSPASRASVARAATLSSASASASICWAGAGFAATASASTAAQ